MLKFRDNIMERRMQRGDVMSVKELFDRYEVALSTSNIDEIAKCYNSSFIMSNADGAQSVNNDDEFLTILERTSGFYKQIGMISMIIDRYVESVLDDSHTLVQIEWHLRMKEFQGYVNFDVTYVVNKELIIFFIAHKEQQRLKEARLLFHLSISS